MPTRSAAKAHRQSLKRQLRNRAVKSAAKTAIKRADANIGSSDLETAGEAVRQAVGVLDRAAKKGVLPRGNVARRKSRLVRRFNAAVGSRQAATKEPAVKKAAAKKAPARKRTMVTEKGRASKK